MEHLNYIAFSRSSCKTSFAALLILIENTLVPFRSFFHSVSIQKQSPSLWCPGIASYVCGAQVLLVIMSVVHKYCQLCLWCPSIAGYHVCGAQVLLVIMSVVPRYCQLSCLWCPSIASYHVCGTQVLLVIMSMVPRYCKLSCQWCPSTASYHAVSMYGKNPRG